MRRIVPVAAVALVAIVAVTLIAKVRSESGSSSMVPRNGETDSSDASVTGESTPAAGAVDQAPGAPAAGNADDLQLARAAAVAAVARTGEVFEAGMISRRDVIGEFATDRFAPVLAERTSRQVVDLLFGLRQAEGHPVDVLLVAQPVTAAAAWIGEGRVAVDVWTVAVFLAVGQRSSVEQWSTVHVEMASVSGRWLVDGWETVAGPAPVPPAEGTFADADAIAEVVGWSPVGVGNR